MPPMLLEFNGIKVSFYSNEHDPIHVHAYYAGKEYGMKVELYLKDGKIVKTALKSIRGVKPFKSAQEKDLEKLISSFKQKIVEDWIGYFIKHVKPKFVIVHKL